MGGATRRRTGPRLAADCLLARGGTPGHRGEPAGRRAGGGGRLARQLAASGGPGGAVGRRHRQGARDHPRRDRVAARARRPPDHADSPDQQCVRRHRDLHALPRDGQHVRDRRAVGGREPLGDRRALPARSRRRRPARRVRAGRGGDGPQAHDEPEEPGRPLAGHQQPARGAAGRRKWAAGTRTSAA